MSVKNDERYSAEYMKDLRIEVCEEDFNFFDDGSIVMFRAIHSGTNVDGTITNVAHVTKTPSSLVLKHLVDELNESYFSIKNLKENIGNIEL